MTKLNFTRAVLLSLVISLVGACGGGGVGGGSQSSQGNGPQVTALGNSTYLFSWDPVTDSRVTGYKLYYATAPFSRAPAVQTISLGTDNTYTFSSAANGIAAGATLYLGIASTGAGFESALSDQVAVAVE